MDDIEQQIPEPIPVRPYRIKHELVLLILLVAVILGASGYVLAAQTSKRSHPNTQLTSLSALTPGVPLLKTLTLTQPAPTSLGKSTTPKNRQVLVPPTTTITLQPTLTPAHLIST